MTRSAVAKRYADALADVVTGNRSPVRPETAVEELRAFEAALKSSAELHTALESPAVAAGRKKAVVGRIVDILKLSKISRNFLFVLVDHRRIGALAEIIESFEETVDERLGLARAQVTSAGNLTEAQAGALREELERLTGKRVRMQFAVDQELIGGAITRIESTVYDGSVRGQLQSLRQRLES
ncbi:MAG TPA: ATP synthase F1 subunit delta [Bryobacteraceae bacterium]